MKTIILAGGYGTRLGSITEEMPKPMVKIGDKPILWHIMKIYSKYGHTDFILSLGYKQEEIKKYFSDYDVHANDFTIHLGTKKIKTLTSHDEKDWKISLIDTGLDTLKGARVKKLEKYLDAGLNMLTYGDGVADIDINKLIKFHTSHGKLLTITGVRPSARFGEITDRNGKILSFKEKPRSSVGLINGGFFVFDKKMLNYLTTDEDCDMEEEIAEKASSSGRSNGLQTSR
jgi:glucose-1-phosphate cytidylyltransferase